MRRVSFLFFLALALVPSVAWAQGDPLGPEFRVNTYTTSFQAEPSVAADSAGNFVVVWSSVQDGSSFGIFGQRYASSGVPVGPEFRVNTYTTGLQRLSSVALDSSGNFVVVWESYTQDGSGYGVFGQRYASSGVPVGPEFRVNTFTTGSQDLPHVASDATGNFVIVWRSFDGGAEGIFGQRYASSGVPVGPEFPVNTYTTGLQRYPSIASDSTGNFVVVWGSGGQDGEDGFGVFGQRYSAAGTPSGPEFRVNTYTTNHQNYAAVVSDTSGNFVVVWASATQDGQNFGIFGQRYASSGTPVGTEFRVNTYTSGRQWFPAVASDGSGNFVVAWDSEVGDGSSSGVFGQRYTSAGAPSGPEFRVNTYTTSSQGGPAVASDTSGNFVVVWTSDTQDGSFYGIFGQRYSQIVPVELPPIADAGPDQTVPEGTVVTLDGSGSSDPNGDPLTYLWEQIGGPTVNLSDPTAAVTSFTAPDVAAGGATLSFRLTVSDGALTSEDTVDITVTNVNQAPVAHAGEDQTVQEGSPVTLHGGDSFDPDNDPLTYEWTQTAGTAVSLSDPSAVEPSFTAPLTGPAGETLVFTLTVSDGVAQSTDEVAVVVTNVIDDFTISAQPPSQTVPKGQSTSYTVTVTPSGGFNDVVTFGVSGLPHHATATFNPPTVTGSGSSTMTVATMKSTPKGAFTLTISGTSGAVTHTTTVTLVVTK